MTYKFNDGKIRSAIGRNGMMQQIGIDFIAYEETGQICPVNSKGNIGNCLIESDLTNAYAVTENKKTVAIFLAESDAEVDAEERSAGQGGETDIDIREIKVPSFIFKI